MGNYQEDLKREAKRWIPYTECTAKEYTNQERKMLFIIEELLADRCIYNICNSNRVDFSKPLLQFYKDRCLEGRECARENILKKLKEVLKGFSYDKENDLEFLLIRNIPINYLKPYDALNVLGLDWCLDEKKEEYQQCRKEAYVYIYELCYERFGFRNKEDIGDLAEKMRRELEIYKPESQRLGSFISARMGNRMRDIWRVKIGQKVSRRKIPVTGEILIKEVMFLDSISVVGMERVSSGSDLKKGQYTIESDRLCFSEEDIGMEVRIKYMEDKEVKERQLQERQLGQKEVDLEAQRLLILLSAQILNYKDVYCDTGKRAEKQKERRQLCFTEKLVHGVKNYGYEEGNLETDAKRVLISEYLDFFMSEVNLSKEDFMLDRLQEVPLKCSSELWADGAKEELKWTKKGWLEGKVPITYFAELKNRKVANSTVTEFREEYGEWLMAFVKKKLGRQ